MIDLRISEVRIGARSFSDATAAFNTLARSIETSADRAAPVIGEALQRTLRGIADELVRKHGNPWSGISSGSTTLFKRSGASLAALADGVKVAFGGSIASIAGSMTIPGTLAFHETGGTITAKGGYLTIPLPAALSGNGTPLQAKARDWQKTFVGKSKAGNLLIFQRGAGGQVTPLYLLRKSVNIPARLGLMAMLETGLSAWEQRAVEALDAALGELV
jgi:hypothetical protein